MRDYLTLGTTPTDEDCAQLGQPDYWERAKKEGRLYRKQLIRQFGEPQGTAHFVGKRFDHDFGTYIELCIVFDSDSEEETNYAYRVENELPENWDEEARAEIEVGI